MTTTAPINREIESIANATQQALNAAADAKLNVTTSDSSYVWTGAEAFDKIRGMMPETIVPNFVHSGFNTAKSYLEAGTDKVYSTLTSPDGFLVSTKNSFTSTVTDTIEAFKQNAWTKAVTENETIQTVASFAPMIGAGVGGVVATDAAIKLGRNDRHANKVTEVAKLAIGTAVAVYSVTNLDDSTTAKVTTAAAVLLTAMAQAINAGAAAPLKRYYFELSKAV